MNNSYILAILSTCTDFGVRGSISGRKTEYAEETPCVRVGNRHTLSHKTIIGHGDQTLVAAVRSKCVIHYATWTPNMFYGVTV